MSAADAVIEFIFSIPEMVESVFSRSKKTPSSTAVTIAAITGTALAGIVIYGVIKDCMKTKKHHAPASSVHTANLAHEPLEQLYARGR